MADGMGIELSLGVRGDLGSDLIFFFAWSFLSVCSLKLAARFFLSLLLWQSGLIIQSIESNWNESLYYVLFLKCKQAGFSLGLLFTRTAGFFYFLCYGRS
jgi:hypothetical protein